MSNYSSLSDLAAKIQSATATIDAYLKTNNLPTPSFHEDGPVDFGLNSEETVKALETAKASAQELVDLLDGPALNLRPTYDGVSLQAIYRYDIARHVPIHGEISFVDLSAKCGLGVGNLERILRFAMAFNRCFVESRKGFVSHSAASRLLVDDPYARAGLGFMFEECWQAFAHTLDAIEEHGEAQDITKTGWSHYRNTDKSLFEYYRSHPEMGRRMSEAMKCFNSSVSKHEATQSSYLVKYSLWETLQESSTVVDLGGAHGYTAVDLAQAYPHLKLVVQDLPDIVKGIEDRFPEDAKGRITVMAHDFFAEQPLQADVYCFSQIFHDWPEEQCIKILRALIPKLTAGAKVVCYDYVLPEPGEAPIFRERAARRRDMIMLSLFNSPERNANDWLRLFQRADIRFGNIKIFTPENSKLGIIETTWEV